MAGTAGALGTQEVLLTREPGGWLSRTLTGIGHFARRKPVGAFAGLIITVIILAGIFAGPISRFSPFTTSPIDSILPPDRTHWFGTDLQGRDVFSRIVHGVRVSVGVGVSAVAIGVTAGTIIGLVSGYFGGWADTLIQRGIDMLMAFPTLILAMAIVSAVGTSTPATDTGSGVLGALRGIAEPVRTNFNIVIAIAITLIPGATRLVRGAVLSVKENQYVEAARSLGASDVRIIHRHVFPNVVAPIIVLMSVVIGQAIISEASLSFLGLGAQEPTPSWGQMLSGSAQKNIETAPWLVIFPGIAIALVVYAFNMFGDALRDVLDPRLRGQG